MPETTEQRGWRVDRLRGVILRLRRLIKTHEIVSVWLVMLTLLTMVVLDVTDRATYQTVVLVDLRLLLIVANSSLWIIFGLACFVWLAVFRKPPQLVWGLWFATALFAAWGVLNLAIGLRANPPVSLVGPMLMLVLAAPLAWFTADTLQEQMQQESMRKGQVDVATRHRAGG